MHETSKISLLDLSKCDDVEKLEIGHMDGRGGRSIGMSTWKKNLVKSHKVEDRVACPPLYTIETHTRAQEGTYDKLSLLWHCL